MTQPSTPSKREELGCAGHFICSSSCRFRRHTQIGNYRISTVGDYYYSPTGRDEDEKRKTVGIGKKDFFETMVFKTSRKRASGNDGCGCRHVEDWGGLEQIRYATAGQAQRGHEKIVEKYGRMK